MAAVADMGRIIKETAELSEMGAAKLVVLPMQSKIILLWRVPSMVLVKQMLSSM